LNDLAVEPIVRGRRGLSELERSQRDQVVGKAMWASEELGQNTDSSAETKPCAARRIHIDGVEAVRWFVHVEAFENGARPIIEITLRRDRPREIGFRIFAVADSAPMDACILTATMGNYAQLRRLWLKDFVVEPAQLWPAPKFGPSGFAPSRSFSVDRLFARDGQAIVAATPNPAAVGALADAPAYDPVVPAHWRYHGAYATQYWRAPLQPGLVARVNARATYWGAEAPIPGGLAFENFELEAPFKPGQEFWFGVVGGGPGELGFHRRD